MASRGDKVKHGVHPVVPEARVTLDTRLLGKNVIILPLKVANNLGEAVTTVSLVIRRKGGAMSQVSST